jgi:hypothetical protein
MAAIAAVTPMLSALRPADGARRRRFSRETQFGLFSRRDGREQAVLMTG